MFMFDGIDCKAECNVLHIILSGISPRSSVEIKKKNAEEFFSTFVLVSLK